MFIAVIWSFSNAIVISGKLAIFNLRQNYPIEIHGLHKLVQIVAKWKWKCVNGRIQNVAFRIFSLSTGMFFSLCMACMVAAPFKQNKEL